MKDNFIPEFIYHYTRVINAFLIFPFMRLKMGKIAETNDPREKINHFEVLLRDENFHFQNECIELIEDFMNNFPTVTCFSAGDNDKKGFDLPTMWAHYTDNHKGICLEINTKKFIRENSHDFNFDKVNYALNEEYDRFIIEKDTPKEELLKKLVFLKRNDWSSENEWRLFSLEGENFCYIKESLESIILGLDFDEKYLPLIKLLIQRPTIKFKRIILDDKSQKFNVKEF